MIITKRDLKLYRIVCSIICLISLIVMPFSRVFGGILLAIGLYFLFAPHKEGDKIGSSRSKDSDTILVDNKNIDAIGGLLDILYRSSQVSLDNLDLHIKIRALLFSYGVIDCYCQASKFSENESDIIFSGLESSIQQQFGIGLIEIMRSKYFQNALEDSFLQNIISVGGQTYNDFVSGNNQRGGMALNRFGSLIGLWQEIDINSVEKNIMDSI